MDRIISISVSRYAEVLIESFALLITLERKMEKKNQNLTNLDFFFFSRFSNFFFLSHLQRIFLRINPPLAVVYTTESPFAKHLSNMIFGPEPCPKICLGLSERAEGHGDLGLHSCNKIAKI